MSDPAVGYRFRVEIDGIDLGGFTKVEGLGAKYDIVSVKEGGENGFVHKLPGRIEYDDVKLTRAVDEKSSMIASWFTSHHRGIGKLGLGQLANATISALDPDDGVVASWSLVGVLPVRYSGPSFQAGSSNVLTETLELSHQGFWGSMGAGVSAAERVV